MPIDVLLNMAGKIVLLIFFGYFLKKRGVITEEMQKGLSNLLVAGVLPCSILASANVEFSREMGVNLGKVALIALAYYILSAFTMTLLSRFLKIDDASRKIFITMSVFANNAFIGFPIVAELFGDENVLFAVVFNIFYNLFMFTYGTMLLGRNGKISIKSIFNSPVTIASLCSVVLFLTPFRLPVFLQDTLNTVGNLTVPISMMIIGCTLTGIKPSQILKDKYSYLVSALRLLIFPLAMFAAMKLLHMDTLAASVCVLMAALPSGSLNVILAEQYDCNPKYAARTVVQSMLLMPFTLPLIILVINLL